GFLDNRFGHAGRRFIVFGEFHGIGGAPLSRGTQIGGIAEHFGQRHFGAHELAGRRVFHALHQTAAAVQVAHHVAHVVFRRHYFNLHDRFEQHRVGVARAFLETHGTGDLERHFRGVHFMVGTVVQGDLDVHHREAGDHAVLQLFLDALVHRRDVFARHHAANNGVDEFVAGARLLRLDLEPDVAELTAAAGLAHEFAFLLDGLANGFAVGHLRLADVGFHLELTLHAVDDDFQMQFAHAGNNGLP